MSVDDIGSVDIISIDRDGKVILTVADHLEWGSEEHLGVLQKKLNTYLAFIESGEIYEKYPAAKGSCFVLEISCKFKPDETGLQFLRDAKRIIERAGFEFRHEVFAASYDN